MFKKQLLFDEKGIEVEFNLKSPCAFLDPYFLTNSEMKFLTSIREYLILKYTNISKFNHKEKTKHMNKLRNIKNKLGGIEEKDKFENITFLYKYKDDCYEERELKIRIKIIDNKEYVRYILNILRILSYPSKNKVDTITKYF